MMRLVTVPPFSVLGVNGDKSDPVLSGMDADTALRCAADPVR